jgi:hypothetical protein
VITVCTVQFCVVLILSTGLLFFMYPLEELRVLATEENGVVHSCVVVHGGVVGGTNSSVESS